MPVIINANGGAVRCEFLFKGAIIAEYTATLYEANSNAIINRNMGDNDNAQDDTMILPTPLTGNNNRRLYLNVSFYGKAIGDYEIKIEVYQDGVLIGGDVDKSAITGGKQSTLLAVKFSV